MVVVSVPAGREPLGLLLHQGPHARHAFRVYQGSPAQARSTTGDSTARSAACQGRDRPGAPVTSSCARHGGGACGRSGLRRDGGDRKRSPPAPRDHGPARRGEPPVIMSTSSAAYGARRVRSDGEGGCTCHDLMGPACSPARGTLAGTYPASPATPAHRAGRGLGRLLLLGGSERHQFGGTAGKLDLRRPSRPSTAGEQRFHRYRHTARRLAGAARPRGPLGTGPHPAGLPRGLLAATRDRTRRLRAGVNDLFERHGPMPIAAEWATACHARRSRTPITAPATTPHGLRGAGGGSAPSSHRPPGRHVGDGPARCRRGVGNCRGSASTRSSSCSTNARWEARAFSPNPPQRPRRMELRRMAACSRRRRGVRTRRAGVGLEGAARTRGRFQLVEANPGGHLSATLSRFVAA